MILNFAIKPIGLLIIAGLLFIGAPLPSSAQETKQKPNVIIIYTDDQGSMDANCYGSKDLVTPTFDKLAATGIRFTQMYSPSAICSASRAGMLTGRFPPRAGVPGNVSSHPGKPGLPVEEVTIAEMLKSAGYTTGHVGKWHLGYTPETMPNGQGFDSSFGHMGGCIDNYSHFFYWVPPNRHDLWRDGVEIWEDGIFFGDSMVRECNAFIDRSKESKKPFFLYWAINWPHYPLQGTDKWREHYKGLPSPRNKYAAFVSSMDERIGLVVDHLEKQGLRDNTIIILQSDHGHSTEPRTFGGGGNAGPYRGAKGCLFEGGIRVPSIISWPDGIAKGEVRDQMATGCDWLPTLADICDVPLPKRPIDGKSISRILKSKEEPSPHKSFYWQLGNQWVVREGAWKLLGNPRDNANKGPIGKDDKLFLANLEKDVSEMKNLAKDYPETVKRLKDLRDAYVAGLSSK